MVRCHKCNRIFGKLDDHVCEDCWPKCSHCGTRHEVQPLGMIHLDCPGMRVSVVGGESGAFMKLCFCDVNCLNDWIDDLLPTSLRCEWCNGAESEEWQILQIVDGDIRVGNTLNKRATFQLALCSSKCFFGMMEGRYE